MVSIKKTAVALATILTFGTCEGLNAMPVLDPLKKKAATVAAEAVITTETEPLVKNEAFKNALDLVNVQIPIEPEAARVEEAPTSPTTSIEFAPIASETTVAPKTLTDIEAGAQAEVEVSSALEATADLDADVEAEVTTDLAQVGAEEALPTASADLM